MRSFCGIAALAVLSATAWLHAAEPLLSPQAGLLLLRNGNVLAGDITQAGDYYVIVLDKSSEIRLLAKDVEAQVATLDEAYELKRHGLFGRGAEPNLDLADWCLRHGLVARCREQLAAAKGVEADNPRIAQIERRLELAIAPRPAGQARPTAPSPTAASAAQIEAAVKSVPRGSVEKFTAVIQPLLMNRCGANSCHGANGPTDFHLLRPPGSQVMTQRFTQRNLYALLQQIDTASPESSPLLVESQRRHGNSLTAPLDKQTQKQFEELKAWVLATVAIPAPAMPATIPGEEPATLSQPAGLPEHPAAALPAASSGEKEKRFTPRDPFDPEIFNRRFKPKQKPPVKPPAGAAEAPSR